MTEQEEFEFRARLEAEQAVQEPEQAPPKKREREPRLTDFSLKSFGPVGQVADFIEKLDRRNLDSGEATIREAFGRGQMDVYQGGKQLGLNAAKFLKENPTLAEIVKLDPTKKHLIDTLIKAESGESADNYNQQLKQELALYDKNNPDFQPSRVAGNLATPLSLIPGGVKSAVGRTGLSTVMGALGGASQPVTTEDYWKTKGLQTALGAGVGGGTAALGTALGPLAKKSVSALKRLSPFGKKAIDRDIVDDVVARLGGSKEEIVKNKALVIKALENADDDMTVAQAIAKANRESPDEFGRVLVKAEKELSKEAGMGETLTSKYAKQQAGRKKVIESLGGTDQNIEHLKAVRAKTTKPFYQLAKESQENVDTKPVMSKVDELISDNKNQDIVVKPLKEIKAKLMDGDTLDSSVKNLQSLSKDIGDMMNVTDAAGKKLYSQSTLTEVKKLLDAQIGKAAKPYKIAQKLHQVRSKPVNRAQMGKVLGEALESPTEKETAAAFTRSLRNVPQTIKKATKFGKFTKLEDVLPGGDAKAVKKVEDALITQAKAGEMAGGTSNVVKEMSTRGEVSLPKILSRPIVVTNAILRRMSQGHSEAYKAELAKVLQDPKHLSKLMSPSATDAQQKMAKDIVRQLSTLAASQTTARGQNNAP